MAVTKMHSTMKMKSNQTNRMLVVLFTTALVAMPWNALGCAFGPADQPIFPDAEATPATVGATRGPRVDNFIWIGTNVDDNQLARQFTDAELQRIVTDYDFVVIARFHCGGSRECQNETARRLKTLRPDIKVLAYHNAFVRPSSATNTDGFNPAWYLRGTDGRAIFTSDRRLRFVDVSLRPYRLWAITRVRGWLADAPWDGVAYDRAQGVPDTPDWRSRVGAAGIARINRGVVRLIGETKAGLGAAAIVVYNGFKDRDSGRQNRRFAAPLAKADGVANEYFCYHKDYGFDPTIDLDRDIIADVNAQRKAAARGKLVLVHVTYQDSKLSAAAKNHINRVCYAAFLLGHRPGLTSYKFGFLTSQRVLQENAAEQAIELGKPSGPMRAIAPKVYKREFANGAVVVNLGDKPTKYSSDYRARLANGGRNGPLFQAGAEIPVRANDDAYLLRAPAR